MQRYSTGPAVANCIGPIYGYKYPIANVSEC